MRIQLIFASHHSLADGLLIYVLAIAEMYSRPAPISLFLSDPGHGAVGVRVVSLSPAK